ncbi:glutamine--fructose-6-phosphate transaminase (isomerizing) [Deefgea rivuli]|uniref:glutamine--fructose-6-phosphate transaminase (isomerizing) n=1 Tax=Deefgea rivuli TaxID=400948 RepID=UPI00068721D0|nr:glutamine--fructose-6-phosphate transaminase (isomerizing) [Deefgea rivuli]
MDTLLGGISLHNIGPQLMRALKLSPSPNAHLAMSYASEARSLLWQGKIIPDTASIPECQQAILRSSDYGALAAAPHLYQDHLCIAICGTIENLEHVNALLNDSESSNKRQEHLIASLIDRHWQQHHDLLRALHSTSKILQGYYTLTAYSSKDPEHIYCTTSGPAFFVAHGNDSSVFASDPIFLRERAALITQLHDGDVAQLSAAKIKLIDSNGTVIHRDPAPAHTAGQLPHFMLREIHAQARNCAEFIHHAEENRLENWLSTPELFANIDSALLIASGSSHHAAQTARFWLESLAGIPTQVELASEFRYQERTLSPSTLIVVISQSGETADTVAALAHAQQLGCQITLAISNQGNSTLMRQAALQLQLHAGEELGATSTKTFSAQLLGLFLLAQTLAKARHKKLPAQLSNELRALPAAIAAVLALAPKLGEWAKYLSKKPHLLFTARHMYYPIAQEGALKFKEVTYLHAEAYPSGELKHGPLALIDNNFPVIACLPWDILAEKLLANLHEVRSKHGEIFALSDVALPPIAGFNTIRMPPKLPHLNPILYGVALQILAYYTATSRGNSVDTPRNISKTVSTE